MVNIGKKYGVSDNSVRKWIKKYKDEELKDLIIDIDREKTPSRAPLTQWKSEGLMHPWSRDQNSQGVLF